MSNLKKELSNLRDEYIKSTTVQLSNYIQLRYEKIIKDLKKAASKGRSEITIYTGTVPSKYRYSEQTRKEISNSIINLLKNDGVIDTKVKISYNYRITIRW